MSLTLLRMCSVAGGIIGVLLACGDEESAERRSCRKLQMYEVNTADQCLEPPIESTEPCIFETFDSSTGVGTDACLVGPEGNAFIVDQYGYTEDIEGDGWAAFWLEIADSAQESNDEGPAGCTIGRALLGDADAACEMNQASDEQACDRSWGFGDAFVEYLPICP